METPTCQGCSTGFIVDERDAAYYAKIGVPYPTFCPTCRLKRRLAWRNERFLYKRTCDATGKEIFSMLHRDVPLTVYEREYWFSDAWDPLQYGRAYDFSRPFFEQFRELLYTVPWFNRSVNDLVNSDYCMNCGFLKDCYLTFDSSYDERCFYCTKAEGCRDCFDSYHVAQSELCYESVMCSKCYQAFWSVDCEDSHSIWFSKNLSGCSNCFGCVNLKNKEYHIFNEPYTKEAYREKIVEFGIDSASGVDAMLARVRAFQLGFPNKYRHDRKSVNVSGDYILTSKNTHDSFMVSNAEDCRYCQFVLTPPGARDCYDYAVWGQNVELVYESYAVGNGSSEVKFSAMLYPDCQRCEYSALCSSSSDLFGCVGLRKKQYCIFNTQYSKEDYEVLVSKIKEHMNAMPFTDTRGRTYRYGEFLPQEFSPWTYNETLIQQYFPTSKEEAVREGYAWRDREERSYPITLRATEIPERYADAPQSLPTDVIECGDLGTCAHECTMAFRLTADEIAFHQRFGVPPPRLCPNCRYARRLEAMNPIRSYDRSCQCAGSGSANGAYANTAPHQHEGACDATFATSYAPEREDIVYCEPCYQAETA